MISHNLDFSAALKAELRKHSVNHHRDNYDEIQLGPEGPSSTWLGWEAVQELKTSFKEISKNPRRVLGRVRNLGRVTVKTVQDRFKAKYHPEVFYAPQVADVSDVSYLYSRLINQESRDLLVQLFAFRILGHKKVRLPRSTKEYWKTIQKCEALANGGTSMVVDFLKKPMELKELNLRPIGYEIDCCTHPIAVACVFVQKQYEYHASSVHLKASSGDIAIDAGGCWGETTLYFAHEVGDTGKVYSFEFIPSNVKVLRANVAKNPKLAPRIEIVEHPIWKTSGESLYYLDRGPGSWVRKDKLDENYVKCMTESIDELVRKRNIPRVNFIKMDIEGAELPALHGAENTIKKFKPKLVISLYHQLSDFTEIPKYLDSLNLGYEFYLDHHTIHTYETVLIAVPPIS